MSDEREEMVTISYEITLAEADRIARMLSRRFHANERSVREACRAALDARKSKYAHWRGSLELPWTTAKIVRGLHGRNGPLLAWAAPQLLDALIAIHRHCEPSGYYSPRFTPVVQEAIRAALPEDVADEVLS